MSTFTKDELRSLIKDTVHETLKGLGVDVEHPLEVQHDLQFARELRTTAQAARKKAAVVAVGTIVAAALAVLWLGLKSYLTNSN